MKRRLKAEFDRIESKMNKISIDQIKKDAKDSVSILEDDFSAANHMSPRISEGMKKKIEKSKTPPLTPSSGKNVGDLTPPSTEDISSRREEVIPEENEVFNEVADKPVTIEELEAELEEELKMKEEDNPFKIDLQELNSLQEVKSMFGRIRHQIIRYLYHIDDLIFFGDRQNLEIYF